MLMRSVPVARGLAPYASRRAGQLPVRHLPALSQRSHFSTVLPPDERPKMVILGVGWGAVNVIRNLDERALKQYNILVCSPTNHFVNTPLLPSVTVGTLGPRAIAEPIRKFLVKHRKRVPEAWIKFNEVEALAVDTDKKKVKVKTRGAEGRAQFQTVVRGMTSATVETEYWIDYDVLVCAVGAGTNTFGTPGALQYCTFLKTVQDAMKIRATLLDCFETAAVRGMPDEEINRLLTFVVIGAGPTGVEVAAEMHDFIKEDVLPRYSGFANREVKVQIVEMSDKMLGTYDKMIQEYCAERFKKIEIEMFTKHQVKKVNVTSVEALDLVTGEMKTLPFGMCVWASGVKPNQISLDIAKDVQGTRMLEVDSNLRVKGAEGSIFALGDCAKFTPPGMKDVARSIFDKADTNKDGVLQPEEFERIIELSRKEFPHIEAFLGEVSKQSVSRMYDKLSSEEGVITREVFEAALKEVDMKLKMLPATAQVAAQQGEYLASVLNGVKFEELGHKDGFSPAFEYSHGGSMAYVGGEHAVVESPIFGVQKGLATYVLWKGVYWGKSVSMTMKFQMCVDWARSWFLGRDTSRL